MELLSPAKIEEIATVLSNDVTASTSRERFYHKLGLEPAELDDLRQRYINNPHGFFIVALHSYLSANSGNATVDKIVDHLKKLNWNNAADKISVFKTPTEKIWFNVPKSDSAFTGRGTILNELHAYLSTTTSTNKIIVSGIGGVGKTQLLIKYAEIHQSDYEGNVIWLDAKTKKELRCGLAEFAKTHLKLSDADIKQLRRKEIMEQVFKKFSATKCLMILDNVGQVHAHVAEVLQKTVDPSEMKPKVLMASRSRLSKMDWGFDIKEYPLSDLTLEEGEELVKKELGLNGNEHQVQVHLVKKLVNMLEGFPLSLQRATAYIKRHLSVYPNATEEFLKRYPTFVGRDILRWNTDNLETERQIWKAHLKAIESSKLNEIAVRILEIVSVFAQKCIPISLFQNMKYAPDDIYGAIILLRNHSLIEAGSGDIIRVRAVFQRITRIKISGWIDGRKNQALDLLNPHVRKTTSTTKQLLPHAVSAWRESLRYRDLLEQHGQFGHYLCEKLNYYGEYAEILDVARESYLPLEKALGENHKYTLQMKYHEGVALYRLGKNEESLAIVETLYPKSEALPGLTKWLAINILGIWALALSKTKFPGEALKKLDELQSLLSKHHPEVSREQLKSQHKRAIVLDRMKRTDEAHVILKSVLEQAKMSLSEDDTFIQDVRSRIADVLIQKQKIEKAEPILADVHQKRKRIFEPDHPQTLKLQRKLEACQEKSNFGQTSLSQEVIPQTRYFLRKRRLN